MPTKDKAVQVVTAPEPTRERVATVGTLAAAVGLIMGGVALFILLVGGAATYAVGAYFGDEGVRIMYVLLGVAGIYLLVDWRQGAANKRAMSSMAELGEVFNRREETDDAGEVRRIAANALPQIINGAAQMGQTSAKLADDMFRGSMRLVEMDKKNEPVPTRRRLALSDDAWDDGEDDELE